MQPRVLNKVEDALQGAIGAAFEKGGYAGKQVKDFLQGRWLGHPLHSALTDIPLGSWTAAVCFDGMESLTGKPEYGVAADAAIGLGLIGAVGSAVTGLTDWQGTSGEARDIGLTHGLLNVAGVTLFASSLAARRRGARDVGKALSTFGFAVGMGAAWLGGHLVFKKGVRVETSRERGTLAMMPRNRHGMAP